MNPMMNPMMGAMNPMMQQQGMQPGMQQASGAQPMQPMAMPQMQPMQPMQPMMMMPAPNAPAPPMACKMTCEMTKDGMICKLTAVDPSHMEMLRERMNAMMSILGMGMPLVISCGGLPMLVGVPTPKHP